MKKISRIIAVLLILLMLATMSVSCKKTDDTEDEAVTSTHNGDEESSTENEGTQDEAQSDSETEGADTESQTDTSDEKTDVKEDNTSKTESDKKTETSDDKKEQQTIAKEEGAYVESEDGTVLETQTNIEVNEDFVIVTTVTNDNGFIPDEEQGLEKSERRATAASKYNFDENPLINRDRQQNKTYLPSFDINDTGFVRAGTKIEDLKGKTLVFFTADNFAAWSYRNEKGETIDEWAWFKQLKSEIGLNIKYTVKQHMNSVNAALQSMNAGKQCDIIYSNHVIFPSSICITRSITELVNINNLGSSPGICKNTMDVCKWGNTLRLIAPIGVVDVLWYNQTLTQELGLSDPHKMWEGGVWSWDTFQSFMYSVPKTTKTGQNLIAFVEWNHNASYCWPSTNGEPYIYIDANADAPTLINNWDDARTLEAWEFITNICNNINFNSDFRNNHLAMYEGTTLMSATMYTQVYRDTEYSKNIQINWVPYPKSGNEGGKDICQYYGFGMMLPKKTTKQQNVDYALKFMELWATRFTETIFDNLHTFEYYNFNYKQRKQYFDFVTQNVVFGLAMNDFSGSGLGSETKFFECFMGNPAYNVKTEAQKASNLVSSYIIESLKYGQ